MAEQFNADLYLFSWKGILLFLPFNMAGVTWLCKFSIYKYVIVYFVGFCNSSSDPPRCTNCTIGWMGEACEDPCVHGKQIPMDSGLCQCDACYVGK